MNRHNIENITLNNFEEVDKLKDNINKLRKLVFFPKNDNIKEKYSELFDDIIFHSESKEDIIKFNWKTGGLDLLCNYESSPSKDKLDIYICYDDGRSETLTIILNNKELIVNYLPLTEIDDEKKYDLINNKIIINGKTRNITDSDIDNLNKIIVSYSKYIISKLPYLNNYINQKTKKKKLN